MENEALNTRERILEFAKKEFLANGFKSASLRNICKTAGVSTGALYGYFKDKDSLFVALIKNVMNGLKELVDEIEGNELQSDIFNLFGTRQYRNNLVDTHNQYIDYIYDNIDEIRLLMLCSEGSSAENYIENITKYIADISSIRVQELKDKGIYIQDFVIHMIIKLYMTSIYELIEHNIPREDAIKYITTISRFFFAGWAELLEVSKSISEN